MLEYDVRKLVNHSAARKYILNKEPGIYVVA